MDTYSKAHTQTMAGGDAITAKIMKLVETVQNTKAMTPTSYNDLADLMCSEMTENNEKLLQKYAKLFNDAADHAQMQLALANKYVLPPIYYQMS